MSQNNISFKWSNYLKPTPANLMFLVDGIKGIIGVVAISTYAQGNEKIGFWLLVSGAVLDFATRFFARVAKETSVVTTTTITLPPEVSVDQVDIKTDVNEV